MRPPPTSTTLRAVDAATFAGLAQDWQDLQARTAGPHYALTHQWLSAWIAAHRPRRLVHVDISSGDRRVAVGLLERLAPRRLRFAGAPVSPRGCLLVAAGEDITAWSALAAALGRDTPRWSLLQCVGAPPAAGGLPRAVSTATPEYAVALPADFDSYVAGLTPAARKGMRRKLRRIADAGDVSETDSAGLPGAVGRFLALHRLRARQRGERHPHMDARLGRLLLALPEHGSDVRLRVFELRVAGVVVASTVRLDHRDTGFFYNGGFDPAHARLSPGISMELASIRDAIERGLTRFDLGPGRYRYKTDLGGGLSHRYHVTAGGPGLPASAIALARDVHGRAARACPHARLSR